MAMLAPEPRLVVRSPLGRFVFKLRVAQKLSVHDLSKKSSVSEETIRKIEGEPRHRPKQPTLVKLAQGFGLEPSSLLIFIVLRRKPRG